MGAPSPPRRHSQRPARDRRPTVLRLAWLGVLAVSVGAVQLADGQQCRVSTGAHGSVESSRDEADVVDYVCGEQETRWVGLLRGINHTHPIWSVRAARYDNGRWQRIKPQPIARAWF